MILNCPHCDTQFRLPPGTLGPGGGRVKCSVCAEIWFQKPDEEDGVHDEGPVNETPDDETPDIPEVVSMQSAATPESVESVDDEQPVPRAGIYGYAAAACVFFVVLVGLLLFKNALIKVWPASASFYQAAGMRVLVPGEGLVFDRVESSLEESGQFLVSGHIINLKTAPQVLPAIAVSFEDNHGNVLSRAVMPPPVPQIKGQDSAPFVYRYDHVDTQADSVSVSFSLTGASADGDEPAHDH